MSEFPYGICRSGGFRMVRLDQYPYFKCFGTDDNAEFSIAPDSQPMSRIVAIDYGTKRIGVAISDPLKIIAQPYGTYSHDEIWDVLSKLAQEGIETLVFGWPLTEMGEESEATERVRNFMEHVAKRFPDLQLDTWDERFTSVEAEEAIRSSGLRMKARREKARVDRTAAAILLRDYLARL